MARSGGHAMLWRLTPLALLLGYGVAFASLALGRSFMAFDDHPGQLYRVWHVLVHGWAPWTWNPGWWTGYPELQFYPPAFAYAGAAIHVASGGALSIVGAYQALVWLAYLAPAATVWLLLRRALGDGWLALPGAFVALTLSAGLASGVEGGVHIGMVAARLGWAALPLIPLVLAPWMTGGRPFPWAIAALIAGLVLMHPAHLPAAVVLTLLAAWVAAGSRGAAVVTAGTALGLAAGLTAFWTLPLLARLGSTRALAWGSDTLRDALVHPLALVLGVLAALGTGASLRARRDPLRRVLAAFPWAMLAVVVVDALVLERLGMRWLPADRVADSAWLAFVLAAGAVVGRLIARAVADRPRRRAALCLAAVGAAALLGLPAPGLALWPRTADWPRYESIERGARLGALWSAARAAPPGRLLFVRSSVPLVYGTEWWRPHSHVTAMTPMAAGRDIVNGTFTHPSPVAALVYRGDAGPGAIVELVERLDGRRLFGRALEELDAGTLNAHADRLGVSVVVALDEDVPRLAALRDNPVFPRVIASPPFVLYARREGVTLPSEIGRGRLRMVAAECCPWQSARVGYYPLWRAISEGEPVATRRGARGDLEVRPSKAGAPIELVYERGRAETAGVAISVVSLITLALVWLAPHPFPSPRGGGVIGGSGCG
jgi:hypothetical protein